MAVDRDGIIYVTDWGNNRLQVFDTEGSFVTKITGDATISKWGKDKLDANPEMYVERAIAQGQDQDKLFWDPVAVDVDDDGRVFVLETCRHRMQVYREVSPYFIGTRI